MPRLIDVKLGDFALTAKLCEGSTASAFYSKRLPLSQLRENAALDEDRARP